APAGGGRLPARDRPAQHVDTDGGPPLAAQVGDLDGAVDVQIAGQDLFHTPRVDGRPERQEAGDMLAPCSPVLPSPCSTTSTRERSTGAMTWSGSERTSTASGWERRKAPGSSAVTSPPR